MMPKIRLRLPSGRYSSLGRKAKLATPVPTTRTATTTIEAKRLRMIARA